ncbi:hypothetical protein AJ88_15710 [Mesorhizobium amorphae CCBAU 01583]|nr:hypothetical protein AJ88_15710 [Mesorhizobium amorphae CCBAU 01583]
MLDAIGAFAGRVPMLMVGKDATLAIGRAPHHRTYDRSVIIQDVRDEYHRLVKFQGSVRTNNRAVVNVNRRPMSDLQRGHLAAHTATGPQANPGKDAASHAQAQPELFNAVADALISYCDNPAWRRFGELSDARAPANFLQEMLGRVQLDERDGGRRPAAALELVQRPTSRVAEEAVGSPRHPRI